MLVTFVRVWRFIFAQPPKLHCAAQDVPNTVNARVQHNNNNLSPCPNASTIYEFYMTLISRVCLRYPRYYHRRIFLSHGLLDSEIEKKGPNRRDFCRKYDL